MSLRLHGPVAIALAFAVPFAVLLATVRTSVGFWDTGDLQTVAWIAGIPYPTGFPGYVGIAWLWTHALPFASVAARLNALSAVAVASGAAIVAAGALLFEVQPVIAALIAWTFAFTQTLWARAAYADVHPLGFGVSFAAVVLALRWALRGDARALTTAVILSGAALAIDNTTILILIGGLVIALQRRWPWRAALRSFAIAGAIVVVAYSYLPLRSAYVTSHRLDPTLALGVEPGRPFWDDHHPATLEGFRALVAGTEWGPGHTLLRLLTPAAVRATVARIGGRYTADEPQGMGVLALVGLGFITAQAPLAGLGLLLAAALPALFGATYNAEADPGRYVFALYAVTALCVTVAVDRTIRAFSRDGSPIPLIVACVVCAFVLARDLVRAEPIVAGRGNTEAADLAARVTAATRADAVVVSPWDWATPLAYHAYVDRAMDRRIVVCALPLDHFGDYARWIRDRQVAIVSDGTPFLPGYRTRQLAGGTPQVYEIDLP